MSSSPSTRQPTTPADPRRALGARGEDAACDHLARLDFAIVARNVRTRHGEIDVIAFDRTVLAFVEVKTLRSRARAGGRGVGAAERPPTRREASSATARTPAVDAPVDPLAGLRWRQRQRLRQLATRWLSDAGSALHAEEIRFDAIGVVFDRDDRLLRIDHVEGAW